jgi:hypothetical protein
VPLSLLGQLVIEIFGQVIVESAWGLGKAAVVEVRESAERKAQLARAQALALADLLVIAASHDHVVTEAERRELAASLPPILAKADVTSGVEAHLEAWSEKLRAVRDDEALVLLITETAAILTDKKRARAFEAVCALLRADAVAAQPSAGPFREAGSRSKADSIRIFARALLIEDDTLERALRRLG